MLQFTSITNVRIAKDLGCQLIASPTKGQIKVTPEAAARIGVINGQYLHLVKDGSGEVYALKGKEGLGGKLAAASKTGAGILTLSSSSAWAMLDGNTESNSHYNIAETPYILQLNEEGNPVAEAEVEGENTVSYYKLTFDKKSEKQVRTASVKKEVGVEDANTGADAVEPATNHSASTPIFEDM